VTLSTGADSSKARWGPDERLVGGVQITSAPAARRWMVATQMLRHRFAQRRQVTAEI
jgi:hypothetical protein